MTTLFYMPGACSFSPHIMLRELDASFTLDRVGRDKMTESGRNFLTINPNGYVPALLTDDGETLTECEVILQYLADSKPELGLMPAPGTIARLRALEWLSFVSSELHQGFSPLFDPMFDAAHRQRRVTHLRGRLSYVNNALRGKDYLLGEQYSAADAYLFTVLGWTRFLGIDMAEWTNLTAFVARVGARPAVQAALKAEGLS
jgi:glutathione S-transferase